MPALARRRLGFHHRPGRRIGDQRAQDRVIELVAAADRLVRTEQRRSGKRQIADGVERLVPDEFVGIAQPFRIEQAVIGDDQCVLQRSAERVTCAPQLRHVLHEPKRARARDFAAECRGVDVKRDRLLADQRMREVD